LKREKEKVVERGKKKTSVKKKLLYKKRRGLEKANTDPPALPRGE